MILRFLRKMGRMSVIMDRGPSHLDFISAKPWVERYFLLFKKRPKWFPFDVFIHKILANDHGEGVHNHPCPYVTIILIGGYWETTAKGKFWRSAGYIGGRFADTKHRVDLEPGVQAITLFLQGPFGLRRLSRSGYADSF